MQSILVTGANGLLGRSITRTLENRRIQVHGRSHEQLDITLRDDVERELDALRPDWVVNCAALCDFNACEANPARSRAINHDAPCRLAESCRTRGIRLCHFSSDYLFDGESNTPYTEDGQPNPLSIYARDKADTEQVFRDHPGHLVLRVSWLFGIQGRTFMSLLPGLLMEKREITVASGKTGSCLYVGDGARCVADMLEAGHGGIYNLVHREPASWEAFASHCLESLRDRGLNPACQTIHLKPYAEVLNSGQARRPIYSVLDVSRIEQTLGYPMIPWREGLRNFLDDLYH